MTSEAAKPETITVTTRIDAPADFVWAAVRDPYAVHQRLAPGFVTDVKKDGDTRVVTFANGFTVRERIVSIDDGAKRLVYSAYGGKSTHHQASMQVFSDGVGTKLVWVSEFLPADLRAFISGQMDKGAEVMRATLEAAARADRPTP